MLKSFKQKLKEMFTDQMVELKTILMAELLADGTEIEIDETTMVASYIVDGVLGERLAEGTYDLADGSKLEVGVDGIAKPKVDQPSDLPTDPSQMESTETVLEVVEQEQVKQEDQFQLIEEFANKNMVLESEKIALQEQLNLQTEKFNQISKELEELKKTSIDKLEKFHATQKTLSEKKVTTWADRLNK